MKGYNTSKDYILLYKLIKSGFYIAAFVDIKSNDNIDVAGVAYSKYSGYSIHIGQDEYKTILGDDEDMFIKDCDKYSLEYIVPVLSPKTVKTF